MTHTATAPQYSNQDGAEDFGDDVKDEDEEIELEEVVEPWDMYDKQNNQQVFYPIRLGDVIDGRYLVEHKLGAGGFSTVWIAHDLEDKRDVALKVMLSGESGDKAIRIQDEIIRNVRDASHFVTYLATFLLAGDGCHHRVEVFPLVGPYLCPIIVRKLPMATRMSAARQLLEALEDLHGVGIIHRDLNDRNCMWGMAPLHNLSRRAKYEVLGRPLKQKIPFVDDLWKQEELVGPVTIPESLCTEEFYLGDFGLAMKLGDTEIPDVLPSSPYCSPDRLHNKDPSCACDMWSYMVLFAELYFHIPPFSSHCPGGIVTSFTMALGPLPEEWKGQYIYSGGFDSWYNQSQTTFPGWSLEETITRLCPDTDPIERGHVYSMMSRVFTYDSEKRLTATQLLRDPSFRFIMDRHGC